MEPLKAEQLTSVKWRVLAIPFGGPFSGKDLDGEYFSPRTDIKADWFPTRPVLWHHAQDQTLKDAILGTEDDLVKEEDGWWGTMWLDRSSQYWARVSALLAAAKVYGSSGALGHLVRKAKDGEILTWPHIEQTLTPTPANPFARVIPAKAADAFLSAGISLGTDLETYLSSKDGGESPAMAQLSEALTDLDNLIRIARSGS
jgi:hypothetical protein